MEVQNNKGYVSYILSVNGCYMMPVTVSLSDDVKDIVTNKLRNRFITGPAAGVRIEVQRSIDEVNRLNGLMIDELVEFIAGDWITDKQSIYDHNKVTVKAIRTADKPKISFCNGKPCFIGDDEKVWS